MPNQAGDEAFVGIHHRGPSRKIGVRALSSLVVGLLVCLLDPGAFSGP